MAKEPAVPIVFDEQAALWLTDFLLSQPANAVPFDWPDPALLLLETLEREGWGLTGNPEEQARVLWLQTILDAGIDSFVLTASIWEHLPDHALILDPDYYKEDWPNASREANLFVSEKVGHRYWPWLASGVSHSFLNLGLHFGSRVLNVIRSNGHPISAKATFDTLISTKKQWHEQTNQPVLELDDEERKGKLFKEMGPKKATLFLLRLAKAGILDIPDIQCVGVPPDVHAVVLSFCTGVMSFEAPVSRDRAVKRLDAFWKELCQKHQLNNTELYWRLWLWGRRFCRPVNCSVCPLKCGRQKLTRGRISTGSYYAETGARWLDPWNIANPAATLDLGRDFLLQYAPEASAPGIRVTEKTVSFMRERVPGIQLSLSDVQPTAADTTEEDAADPFEDF